MKQARPTRALLAAGLMAASVSLGAPQGPPDDGTDAILRAYMEAPETVKEIETLRSQHYVDRGARAMEVAGSCGIAGCYVECLVVHLFSTPGVNPQTTSILARVQVLVPSGKPKVERVELKVKPKGPAGDGR